MIKKLLLTIILSVLIIVSFTLMLYSKLLAESEILKQLDEMNYYDYAYKDITSKLEQELPNNELKYVYDKYVTKDKIKSDIKSILDNYYNKENDSIEKEFYNNVFKNFGSKDNENIKSLCNTLANTYYNNLFKIDKLSKIIKLLPFKNASKGLAFVFLAATIFLIVLFHKNIAIYNSFIVTGILFLIPKLFILLKDIIKNFYYYNNTLSYFIKMYGYNIINTYFKYGLILLIVGVIGLTLNLLHKDN